jgi:hypothetical protein
MSPGRIRIDGFIDPCIPTGAVNPLSDALACMG